jgi:hypothetical protein
LALEGEVGVFFGELEIALEDAFGAFHGFARVKLFGEFGVGAFEACEFDFGADEEADGGDETDFALTVNVRLAALEIDDADKFVSTENGNREKGFEAILWKFAEGKEARIFEGVAADGDGKFVFGDPPGDTVADLKLEAIHDLGVRIFGGAEDELVFFENIDEAGIKFGDDGDEVDYFAENFMERIGGGEAAANFVEKVHLPGVAVQYGVAISHRFNVAGRGNEVQCKIVVGEIGKMGEEWAVKRGKILTQR